MATTPFPEISIGLPVYNGDKYLREALDSLLAQTFSSFELIISDNASTDDTADICRTYARRDARIRYFRQHQNRGAIANFQFVLDNARGRFFCWAAADDRWDIDRLEKLYAQICKESKVAIFGNLEHIDEHSRLLQHPANRARLSFAQGRLHRKLAFYLAYEGQGKANLIYALYPRTALQGVDLMNYRYDYQVLFRLLDRVSFTQIPSATLFKRIHSGCEGNAARQQVRIARLPMPMRVLWNDAKVALHYLQGANPALQAILLLFLPLKLLVALKYHALRVAALRFGGSSVFR